MSTDQPTTARWGSEAIDPSRRNLPSLKAKYLLSRLPDAGAVLEVGSGDGKFLRTLVEQRPGLRVHGCDIRAWNACPPGIDFRVMTRDIPYPDATFDAVLIVDVLEHVPDPAHLIAEISRVLVPGGRLVGFVPIEGEPLSVYALCRKLLGPDLYERTKHHVQALSHADLQRLLEAEFDVVDTNYAYHALGHAMDALFFAAASVPRLGHFWWNENDYYTEEKAPGLLPLALNRILELGNAISYVESTLLAKRRIASAGVLFDARRP